MSRIAAIKGVLSKLAAGTTPVALAAGGAAFGAEVIGAPVVGGVEDLLLGGQRQEGVIQSQRAMEEAAWASRLRTERLRQDAAASAERLARTNPTLYASLLARRPLPDEAVWIGGTPGQDLLDEIAMGMAEGRFEMPQSAVQQYQG